MKLHTGFCQRLLVARVRIVSEFKILRRISGAPWYPCDINFRQDLLTNPNISRIPWWVDSRNSPSRVIKNITEPLKIGTLSFQFPVHILYMCYMYLSYHKHDLDEIKIDLALGFISRIYCPSVNSKFA